MKKILFLLTLFLLATFDLVAQIPICTVTGRLYKVTGEPWGKAKVTITKVIKNGYVISTIKQTVTADDSGDIIITVPRNSVAYMYTTAVGLEESGRTGMPLTIPDSPTATLAGLIPATTIPTGYIITIPALVVN